MTTDGDANNNDAAISRLQLKNLFISLGLKIFCERKDTNKRGQKQTIVWFCRARVSKTERSKIRISRESSKFYLFDRGEVSKATAKDTIKRGQKQTIVWFYRTRVSKAIEKQMFFQKAPQGRFVAAFLLSPCDAKARRMQKTRAFVETEKLRHQACRFFDFALFKRCRGGTDIK